MTNKCNPQLISAFARIKQRMDAGEKVSDSDALVRVLITANAGGGKDCKAALEALPGLSKVSELTSSIFSGEVDLRKLETVAGSDLVQCIEGNIRLGMH